MNPVIAVGAGVGIVLVALVVRAKVLDVVHPRDDCFAPSNWQELFRP